MRKSVLIAELTENLIRQLATEEDATKREALKQRIEELKRVGEST